MNTNRLYSCAYNKSITTYCNTKHWKTQSKTKFTGISFTLSVLCKKRDTNIVEYVHLIYDE